MTPDPHAGPPRGPLRRRLRPTWPVDLRWWGALLLVASGAGCGGPAADPAEMVAPGDPVAGLSPAERGRFLLGKALFERVATVDEGLGPLYNAERCSSCHDQPAVGGGGDAILVLKATAYLEEGCNVLRAEGGDNIQQRVTPLLAQMGIGPEVVPASATDTVRVTAPPLFGLGLLEAVPEEALLAMAREQADGGIVSGRVPVSPAGAAARFGRKGDAVSVADFVDTALRFELGLTTEAHPVEERRNGELLPSEADPMEEPEIDGETMGLLVDYVRYLAAPSPEPGLDRDAARAVRRGQETFAEIGCVHCHVPELTTGDASEAVLSRRTIRPYSDLLVHDMGEGLADVCSGEVARAELRTAPLWGLRYRGRLLHDGRATDVLGAVASHGGEAESAARAFASLSEERRAELLRFLMSL